MRSRKGPAIFLLLSTFVFGLLAAAPVWADTATAPVSTAKIDGEYGFWLPPNIATQNQKYAHQGDWLINVLHVFMVLLFVGWGIFFVYCIVRFRARPGHKADSRLVKAKVSKYLEVGVAVFEAALLIGLAIPAWAQVKTELPPADKNPFRVKVIAEQLQWNFHYAGPDGKFGKTSPTLVNSGSNPLGVDRGDPSGADDFASGEFHIPVDRPVIAEVTSKDVIHSFFIPVLRVKHDAIPGMRFPVWFEAGKTGNYEVACAQLCGNNHFSMRALMVVEKADAFAAWVAEKSKPAEEFKD